MDKRILTLKMIKEAFEIRDRQIERVKLATETRKRIAQARSKEERDKISLPKEYEKFGNMGYHIMCSNVSGYTLIDKDNAVKSFYGALGAPASLLIPTVFRGEIMDYGKTSGCSSLGRYLLKCGEEKEEQFRYLLMLEEQMRIMLFGGFLSNFKQFKEFPFASPRPELIAQHYGLNTQFLDLTDDIKVAMFFACCKHIENNDYIPVTKKDIDEMGEYGVIYVGIDDVPCIGCQPFCRCHRQRGYYLDTTCVGQCWKYSLSKDKRFNKFYFKRTAELSEMLYNEFKGGKKLFPQDELSKFEEQITQIKSTKDFSFYIFDNQFNCFCKYLDKLRKNGLIGESLYSKLKDKTWVKSNLESNGIRLQEQIQLTICKEGFELLQKYNNNWNPAQFEEDDGFVYSPFIVRTM